jgi:hypothetical protein
VPSEIEDNYRSNITRQEFAKAAVYTYAANQGLTPEDTAAQHTDTSISFTDTSDQYVLCAASLGIVSGRGNGVFDPDTGITREEAALMLENLAKNISDVGETNTDDYLSKFADKADISDWAREAVGLVSNRGWIVGTDASHFNPKGMYTREQAICVFERFFEYEYHQNSITYINSIYGLSVELPQHWTGYTVLKDTWKGTAIDGTDNTITGMELYIRNPLWTDDKPYQDIPIMIFTQEQWKEIGDEETATYAVSAAPIPPSKLSENSKYVFALPARYDFYDVAGINDVHAIITVGKIQGQIEN